MVVGSVNGEVSNVKYNNSPTAPTNAGSYPVTASFIPTDTINYETLSDAPAGTLVINKATPTLSVDNPLVTYDGSPHAAVVIGSVPGTASNVKYSDSATFPTDVGAYTVTADFTPTDALNYKPLTAASAGDLVIKAANPALTLTASASPTTFAKAGDVIKFSFVLKNTSDVPLAGAFTVTADKVTVTCPATSSLAVNAAVTYSASYTIKAADVTAGSVKNTAVANGHYAGNAESSNVVQTTLTYKPASTKVYIYIPIILR